MARPRPLVPPTTASRFDERSSCSTGIGRMVILGSGTPLMEVFCFRGVWESLTVKFFEAFTDASFLMWQQRSVARDRRRGPGPVGSVRWHFGGRDRRHSADGQ